MNNYHIYEKIGRGKHSTVYKGRKKKTISYYAIKSVDKSQKNRVLQEVRTMHALDHKNILKFYNWYETTNHLWLILEYCVGGDLMSLLRKDVKLPESSVHDFGRDLVVALQYLHAHSIIYCDLKPSNTLLDENGRLKLGGFGLSRRLADINKKPLTALPQALRGSPTYMAPELFSDHSTHSTASDLWGLGCVLYECSMGRAAFCNTSFNQLVQDILHTEPLPIPGASPEFSNLLKRLLDKNPATRINWEELVEHPFWHVRLPHRDMPPEPALDAFIARYNLRPTMDEVRASVASLQPLDKSKVMRQSVDVTRLSRIAQNNLEKEGDALDYAAAEVASDDIRMENTDAELDFEEVGDEEEVPPSPAQSDDGSVIDQAASTPLPLGERVTSAMDAQSMRASSSRPRGEQQPASSAKQSTGGIDSGSSSSSGRAPATPAALAVRAGQGSGGGLGEGGGPTVSGRTTNVPAGGRPVPVAHPGAHAAASDTSPFADTGDDDMERGATHAGGDIASLEQLIWHSSDTAVKPIVANRRIERTPEPRFDERALPFKPMTLAEMCSAEQADLEAFLTHIYRAIASAAPLKDKVNVLSYFETLCCDTGAANTLINSSLTVLFVRMLRNARAPTLRIRLASVLGLLVRHATYIADTLAQTGVIEILSEALKDKNERVRRRVMATLGELLFYIATQQADAGGPGGSVSAADVAELWGISSATISTVARLLKPTEDEIAQHYAVKTVENICSQGGEWAAKFGSQDVVYNLVQIYTKEGRGDNLKATTATTLARLLRHSPSLVAYVVDKFGVRLFVAGLTDSSAKVQAAALNMLNLALLQPDLTVRAKAALSEERSLVKDVMVLMDHAQPLLRAKAVVAVLLLCRLSTRWLLETCKAKLIPSIERLQRERDDYLEAAIAGLRTELGRLVPTICQQINDELGAPGGRKTSSGISPGRPSASSTAKNPLLQFQVVLHLITSPYFRAATVTPTLLADLAAYLTAGSGPANAAASVSMQEFRATVEHVLEAIVQQADLVLQHYDVILATLLPALCAVVGSPAESGDRRFFCLRMVSDVLQLYLNDEELYGRRGGALEGASAAAAVGVASAAVDGVLRSHILPLLPTLLQDEDPMPLYALKLLGGLLEVNSSYVADVENLGLADHFFHFLSLEHSNNNVHNIRLCRQIIAAGSMGVPDLLELEVAQKVCAVLEYATQNAVEPFLEPVLELCHTLIAKDMGEVAEGRSDGSLMASFLEHAPTFLETAAHMDASVAIAAGQCVADLVMSFPAQCAPWLLCPDSLAQLVPLLLGEQTEVKTPPELQLLLLDATAQSLAVEGAVQVASPELLQLLEAAKHVMTVATDVDQRTAAAAVVDSLEPLLQL